MKESKMPEAVFAKFAGTGELPICLTPRRVDAVVFALPAEPARICNKCGIKKPATDFSVVKGAAALRVDGLPCPARLCTTCERAAFVDSLKVGSTVYLRETVEATDAKGNPEFAAPGTPVKVRDVMNTVQPYYCELRVCRTVHGSEKRVTVRYALAAHQLCKTRAEALGEGANR